MSDPHWFKYPKIHTLFSRDPTTGVILPEKFFSLDFYLEDDYLWDVTEKLDGTNTRVKVFPDGTTQFGGRTDKAQMFPSLLATLQEDFKNTDRLKKVLPDGALLFGEGYGAGIQRVGKNFKKAHFVILDIRIGDWWLSRDDVIDVAYKLNIPWTPGEGKLTTSEIWTKIAAGLPSILNLAGEEGSPSPVAEGVVARSPQGLRRRDGSRLMWKLKYKDIQRYEQIHNEKGDA